MIATPLYVFFGAESEYLLHPLFEAMRDRGYPCLEIHAVPHREIGADLAAVAADPRPKILVTSSHFSWDRRYMDWLMEVPDCPALVEIIGMLNPVYTVWYPHDLSQALLMDEVAKLSLVDLYLAPSPAEHMFAHLVRTETVGWIKAVSDIYEPAERWGRGLFLTMSLECVVVEKGPDETLKLMENWLHDWLWIKFAPFPQFAPLEEKLKARGINILDRNMTPPDAARHFDFVVTNGESSVVREAALSGITTYLVTDIGLFGDVSRRFLWQFADLDNVHIVRTFDDIPDDVPKSAPTILPFDMEKAVALIVDGAENALVAAGAG